MKPVRLITFAAAVIIGVTLALLIIPAWRQHRALNAIVSDDPATRQSGWDWLNTSAEPGGTSRAVRLLDDLNARLAAAGDDALLHGALMLRGGDLWGWDRQEHALILREIGLRARMDDPAEHAMALELLERCPLEMSPPGLSPVFNALLAADDEEIRAVALVAACGFAGRGNATFIADLDIPADDVHLQRMHHLTMSWIRPRPTPPMIEPDAPVDLLEAMLLGATIADPADASPVLEIMESWSGEDRPAFEYMLRFSDDRRAARALERLADTGNRAARYALQARARHLDEAQARSVAGNENRPREIRRMAAWRWDRVPVDLVENMLSGEVADPDGNVHAAALLAERRLPRARAVALAEAWIRSFDDDEKRAGALLAALLGAHGSLLARAHELEDVGEVRTTQRLALWAMGQSIGDADPLALAHRALHDANGDFSADVAACMLLAGRAETMAFLTSPPSGASSSAVRRRAWLIERFAPSWHEAIGRPIGGSRRALLLHFDRLEALRMLTHRRLRFDPERKTYTATGSASSGDSSDAADPPA